MRLETIPSKLRGVEQYQLLIPSAQDLGLLRVCDVVVDMRVRNEVRTICQAVKSVIPIAKRIAVTDTGSDDGTLISLRGIANSYPQVQLSVAPCRDMTKWSLETEQQPPCPELTALRNVVIAEAQESWIWVVDGDEIYTPELLQYVQAVLRFVPDDIWCVFIPINWVVDRYHIAAQMEPNTAWSVGRLFRRRPDLHVAGAFMGEQHCYGDMHLWYAQRHCAVMLSPGFYHYEIATKPHRRDVAELALHAGIPEIAW